jgi:predicted AAA+ superfamily ATPase
MISREIFPQLVENLSNEKIIILKGARQTGKTTLLRELEKHISQEKKAFLFADNLSNKDVFSDPESLIRHISLKYGFAKGEKFFLFIDEFQYIENAGLFLKNLYDEYAPFLKIIVSGSSSLEITKNTEFLTGRHYSFFINRLSFRELFFAKFPNISSDVFPRFSLQNWNELEDIYKTLHTDLSKSFEEYLRFGGYPAVVTKSSANQKIQELQSLLQTYIEKDVIALLHVENTPLFHNLLRVLSSQLGQLCNISALSKVLQTTEVTIKKYLNILEGTFLIKKLSPFFANTQKTIKKMPKPYFLDLGLINFLNRDIEYFSEKIDRGDIAENAIALFLIEKFQSDTFFYRTTNGAEVDFIVETNSLHLFEVKYQNNPPRFHKAFGHFADAQKPVQEKIIITKDTLEYNAEKNTYLIPAALFFLVY